MQLKNLSSVRSSGCVAGLRSALAVALFAISSPALSQGPFSASIVLGQADQESSVSGLGSVSGDDMSYGLRAAYAFTEYVAVELSYQDFGEAEEGYIDDFGDSINDTMQSSALSAGVRLSVPFQSGFSLLGRAGLSKWDYDFEETDSAFPGEVFKAGDDGTDLYYGVGAEYRFADRMTIGIEYTVFDMDASALRVSIDHEVKNLALSLGVRF